MNAAQTVLTIFGTLAGVLLIGLAFAAGYVFREHRYRVATGLVPTPPHVPAPAQPAPQPRPAPEAPEPEADALGLGFSRPADDVVVALRAVADRGEERDPTHRVYGTDHKRLNDGTPVPRVGQVGAVRGERTVRLHRAVGVSDEATVRLRPDVRTDAKVR